jgi:uncharacterized protein (TIGR02147 family)
LKSIFEYDNYREYLKDVFAFRKSQRKGLSIRNFARLAGFQSHSFVIFVLQGTKDLSQEGIGKFSKALKHTKDEAYFFKNLVLQNQAKSSSEKARFTQEILRSRSYRKIYPLKESQMLYFSSWYYIVVREMVNLPNFKDDPEWIAKNTEPSITPKEAKEALEQLLKLGLLERNKNGKIIQANPIVASPDEVMAPFMANLHREFMKRASESIDLVPRENRDLSFLTFRVSEQTAKKFKEKIQNFRRELAEEASLDPHPEAIFQLNLQLFPVTPLSKVKNGGGHKE